MICRFGRSEVHVIKDTGWELKGSEPQLTPFVLTEIKLDPFRNQDGGKKIKQRSFTVAGVPKGAVIQATDSEGKKLCTDTEKTRSVGGRGVGRQWVGQRSLGGDQNQCHGDGLPQ